MQAFRNYLPVLVGLFSLLMVSCKKDDDQNPDPASEFKLEKVSGDNQTGLANQPLGEPLKVKFTNKDGAPVENKFVEFLIVSGDGTLSTNRAITNQDGEARVTWTLGPKDPVQKAKAFLLDSNNQPVSTAVVEFTATLRGIKLEKVSGDNQTGWANLPLNLPLVVKFINLSGVPEANKSISFMVATGNGTLSADTVTTNQSGEAQVTWTLGPTAPVQTVKAFVLDASNQPVASTEVEFAANMKTGITVAGGNGLGSAANQFYYPQGVFVDANGNVFVADIGNDRIMKWAPGATIGVTVAGGNGQGNAADQLNQPEGVFVDANGNIYVADTFNDRIQKWAPGATSGITVTGGSGSAASQLRRPTGVFVDANGRIFVADTYNNRIQRWTQGATSGITVAGGNGRGSAANQLDYPQGIFADANGNIFVADALNNRIQKWASGASNGVTVAGGNVGGNGADQLNRPEGVFVDASGHIFVADTFNDRIQKWAPGATSGITVTGGSGSAASQLRRPTGVFVDANGNLFISDAANHRIQKVLP